MNILKALAALLPRHHSGSDGGPSRHHSLDCSLSAKLAIALLALLFHVSGALWTAAKIPFPSTIDELQHLSYVQEMAEVPILFPRFEKMRILNDTLGAFTPRANYLNHPSPYYHLMALIDDPAAPAVTRIWVLRVANLVLSSLGIILMLFAGMTLLSNLGAFALFAAILVMFPKLAIVGGLINNDNLGVLATGLCFVGLARLHRGGGNGAGMLFGLGIALAGWTKLTVLVMIGFVLIASELLRLGEAQDRRRWLALGVASAIGAVGFIPTIWNFITYGRPLYIYTGLAHNFVPVAERPALDFLDHAVLFLHQMVLKWPALEPAQWIQIVGLAGAMAAVLTIIAVEARARWRCVGATPIPGPGGAANLIAAAYGLSVVTTLAVHITFGWRVFLEMGDLTSAQPRYYYVVWPGLALAITLALRLLPPGRPRAYVSICLLAALAVATIQFAVFSAALTGTPLAPH